MTAIYTIVTKNKHYVNLHDLGHESLHFYRYSLHLRKPRPRKISSAKPKVFAIKISEEAKKSLAQERRKIVSLTKNGFGYANVHISTAPRTLLLNAFFPLSQFDEAHPEWPGNPQLRGKGIGTAFLLGIAEHLKTTHPQHEVIISRNLSGEAENMFAKLNIVAGKRYRIEDLHAKVKRYAKNPQLRSIARKRVVRH